MIRRQRQKKRIACGAKRSHTEHFYSFLINAKLYETTSTSKQDKEENRTRDQAEASAVSQFRISRVHLFYSIKKKRTWPQHREIPPSLRKSSGLIVSCCASVAGVSECGRRIPQILKRLDGKQRRDLGSRCAGSEQRQAEGNTMNGSDSQQIRASPHHPSIPHSSSGRAPGKWRKKRGNERKQTGGERERGESAPSLSIGRLDTIRPRVKGSEGGGSEQRE